MGKRPAQRAGRSHRRRFSDFDQRVRHACPRRRNRQGRAAVLRFAPLRVEDGHASLTLLVARTKYGAIQHAAFTPDLAPDDQQIDRATTWERPLAEGRLRLGIVWSRNPGDSASEDPTPSFLAGARRAF